MKNNSRISEIRERCEYGRLIRGIDVKYLLDRLADAEAERNELRVWKEGKRGVEDYLELRHLHDKAGWKIERLEAEVERLRESQRWVPVSEGLPKRFKSVLVLAKNKSTGVLVHQVAACANNCWFLPNNGSDDRRGYSNNYTVTHWQPLPEPPEEGESK